MSNEYVEVDGVIRAVTDKSVLIEFADEQEEWIPKSQIQSGRWILADNIGDEEIFEIDKWLAMDLGLI